VVFQGKHWPVVVRIDWIRSRRWLCGRCRRWTFTCLDHLRHGRSFFQCWFRRRGWSWRRCSD
jgi:hypothetical protein